MEVLFLVLTENSKQLFKILNFSRCLNFSEVLSIFLNFLYLHRIFFSLSIILIFLTLTFLFMYSPSMHPFSRNSCLLSIHSIYHSSSHKMKVLFSPLNNSYLLFIFRIMKLTFLPEFSKSESGCALCLFLHRHCWLFRLCLPSFFFFHEAIFKAFCINYRK